MIKYCILAVVLLAFVQLSAQVVYPLPAEVTAFSGSRAQRYYHLFFHTTRLHFLRLGAKQQHALRNLGWEPRPASTFKADGTEIALLGNNNGEDFLFMHRVMIGRTNAILKTLVNNPYKKVVGWKTCPAPGDKEWPVPASYVIPDQEATVDMINLFKSDAFYWEELKTREDRLRDDTEYLQGLTLGQLGAILENEIHFFMHNRFSGVNTVGYRIQNPMTPVDRVDEKWDNLAYDWLGDFYSAHVHPTFWKIHGWVENRITDWQKANTVDRIFWVGTWEGGPPEAFNDLAKVSSISETGVNTSDSEDGDTTDVEQDQNIGQIIQLLVKLAN